MGDACIPAKTLALHNAPPQLSSYHLGNFSNEKFCNKERAFTASAIIFCRLSAYYPSTVPLKSRRRGGGVISILAQAIGVFPE